MNSSKNEFNIFFSKFPFIALDKDTGKIIDVNKKLLDFIGYRFEEVIGEEVDRFFPDGDYSFEQFVEKFDSSSREFQNFEWRVLDKNGNILEVIITLKTLLDEERDMIFAFLKNIRQINNEEKKELELFYGISGNEQQLRENLREVELILWAADEGFWNWNIPEGVLTISETWIRILGYSHDNVSANPLFWLERINCEDVDKIISLMRKYLRNEIYGFETEFRFKKFDGSIMWIKLRGKVVNWNEKLEPTRFTGTLKDITYQKKTQERLDLVSRVFDENQESIVITDNEFKIREINKQFEKHTGYTIQKINGKDLFYVITDSNSNPLEEIIKESLNSDGKWQGEVYCKNTKNTGFPAWASISTVKNPDGAIQNYLALFTDISQLKKAEVKLNYLAHFDQLTNLPNRTLLYDRIQNGIFTSQRTGNKMAVIFMDLDNFKIINDSLGHFAGDMVLVEITKRLQSILRKTDTIARWGGDEFVILINEIKKAQQLETVLEKIMVLFTQPLNIMDKMINLSTSIGVAICPENGGDRETLLKNADIAMYHSKQHGKNKYTIFEEEMSKSVENHIEFNKFFSDEFNEDLLDISYLPIFDDKSEFQGVEIIPLWKRDGEKSINSRELLLIAENSGMIGFVEKWALKKTFEKIEGLNLKSDKNICVSIKIPFGKIYDESFLNDLKLLIKEHCPENINIIFEIPESNLIHNGSRVINRLKELREVGVKICVDDFGKGFGSFDILKKFPIDYMKINKISVSYTHLTLPTN